MEESAQERHQAVDARAGSGNLSGWPYVCFKARIDLVRFLMGIGYERSIEYPWVFNALEISPRDVLIDIGSGNTIFPLFVKRQTRATVHAVDLDESILRLIPYAQKAGLSSSLADETLVIRQTDSVRLPYGDEAFDCLSCISTIEHVPDDGDPDMMRELMRVVKPGGRLALSVPINKRHTDVFIRRDVYDRKFTGDPVFFERQYDSETIYSRLIVPSGARLTAIQAFGEPAFEFGRRVYYRPRLGVGGILKPFRWLMPAFAHKYIQPIPLQDPPPRSFCCFALQKV